MNFCSCGNTECICDGRCLCVRRNCLCPDCDDLRRKDCKICSFPLRYRNRPVYSTAVNTCQCESSSSSNLSFKVATKIEISGRTETEREAKVQGLYQIPSKKSPSPVEQEIASMQDTKAGKLSEKTIKSDDGSEFPIYDSKMDFCLPIAHTLNQKTSPLSESVLNTELPPPECPTSSIEKKQIYKTVFTDHSAIRTDDFESYSKELDSVKQSDLPSDSWQSCQYKHSRSVSGKSSDSDIGILEYQPDEWNTSVRTQPYLYGDPMITLTSDEVSSVSSDQLGDIPFPSVIAQQSPMACHSISSIPSISTIPRTVSVSPPRKLTLQPLPHFPQSQLHSSSHSRVKSLTTSPIKILPSQSSAEASISSKNRQFSALQEATTGEPLASKPKAGIADISTQQTVIGPKKATMKLPQESAISVDPKIDEYTGKQIENIEEDIFNLSHSKLDELPKSKLDELPKSKLDELPKSKLDELPKSKLDELPKSKLDELPKSKLDEFPETKRDEFPETKRVIPKSKRDEFPKSKFDKFPEKLLENLEDISHLPELEFDEHPEHKLDKYPGKQLGNLEGTFSCPDPKFDELSEKQLKNLEEDVFPISL